MSFDSCLIPPAPSSARTLASFFPMANGHTPLKNIEFPYAWMRKFRNIARAASNTTLFPLGNIPTNVGTITGLTSTTLTDSGANFSANNKCGKAVALTACIVQIFYKDDPRYVAKSTITGSTSTTLTLNQTDWVARGICASLSDLVGSQYAIYQGGDLSHYDRWPDPPNAIELVSCPTLVQGQGIPGSFGNFPTQQIIVTATAGTYTLATGGGNTGSIAFDASASDIQTAISAVAGNVAVIPHNGAFAVAFAPGVSTTLSVHSSALTGTVSVLPVPAFTLLDPVQNWIPNQFANASTILKFADHSVKRDLMIWDNGGPTTTATAVATVTPTTGSLGQVTLAPVSSGGSGYTSPTVLFGTVTVGSGATGTATIATAGGSVGTLSAVNLGNSGANYTSPIVTVTDPTGTGAIVTAAVGAGGGITSFAVTSNGTGYTNPSITITDSTGSGASAIPILYGGILSVTITAPGSLYSLPPPISISDPTGTGAAATATLASGPISSITASGGSGYASTPSVQITSPNPSDGGGSATASISGGTVSSPLTVTSGGLYTNTPTVTLVGGGGDMLVHRFPLLFNTENTIFVASLGGWTPSLNFYYSVIGHDPEDGNSIWNPQHISWHRPIWYSGAYQGTNGALSHFPDDSISVYGQPAAVVYFDGGVSDISGCQGDTPFNAFGIDVINGCCESDCCSTPNKLYAPNFWKSVSAWQQLLINLSTPWVISPYVPSASLPHTWTFAETASILGINAGSGAISFSGTDYSKAYISGLTLPPAYSSLNYPIIYYAVQAQSTYICGTTTQTIKTVTSQQSVQVGQDGGGVFIPGVWDVSQAGWTVFWSWGFDCPTFNMFRLMRDQAGWIPSEDDAGGVVVPPGVSDALDMPTATCTETGGVVNFTFSITHAATGLSSVPTITFTGGGGSGAKAYAVVTAGALTNIVRVSGGSGYTSAPTMVFHGGGPVLIGGFRVESASTNYLQWPMSAGDTGPAYAAGDIAQYQAKQAYQATLGEFSSIAVNPTMQYVDQAEWIGTCGATPPNPIFAGKKADVKPTGLFYSLDVASDGTGTALAAGTVASFKNSSGLTSQISITPTVSNNWLQSWYSTSGQRSLTVSGTATGGGAGSLVDSGQTFGTRLWGCAIAITQSGVTTGTTINGSGLTPHTLNLANGMTIAAGNTYSILVPDCTIYVDTGQATGGGSTTMVDATRTNSPWFASGYYDASGGNTLRVYHSNGDGSQSLLKFRITGTTQSTGTLTVAAVDGQTINAGDLWEIDIPNTSLNKWRGAYATFKLSSGSVQVKIAANDQSTLFIDTPPAGFTLTGAESFTIDTFLPGDVLKRDPTNTKWLSTFGQTETRTDHATGGKPKFHESLNENLPGIRMEYGTARAFTINTVNMWNQMYKVVTSLALQMTDFEWWEGSCFDSGGTPLPPQPTVSFYNGGEWQTPSNTDPTYGATVSAIQIPFYSNSAYGYDSGRGYFDVSQLNIVGGLNIGTGCGGSGVPAPHCVAGLNAFRNLQDPLGPVWNLQGIWNGPLAGIAYAKGQIGQRCVPIDGLTVKLYARAVCPGITPLPPGSTVTVEATFDDYGAPLSEAIFTNFDTVTSGFFDPTWQTGDGPSPQHGVFYSTVVVGAINTDTVTVQVNSSGGTAQLPKLPPMPTPNPAYPPNTGGDGGDSRVIGFVVDEWIGLIDFSSSL